MRYFAYIALQYTDLIRAWAQGKQIQHLATIVISISRLKRFNAIHSRRTYAQGDLKVTVESGRCKDRFPLLQHALLSLAALSTAGGAQAESIKLPGALAVVSDYRFRGYSLSDGQPALQGGLTLTSPAGFYANAWASTIDEYASGASGGGATVELDLGVGRAFSIGAYDIHAAAVAYTYPGGHGVNFVEIPVSVSHAFGAWAGTLGAAYAPAQSNLGNKANTYVYGSATLAPITWPICKRRWAGRMASSPNARLTGP